MDGSGWSPASEMKPGKKGQDVPIPFSALPKIRQSGMKGKPAAEEKL
jgi:hypothetical protein